MLFNSFEFIFLYLPIVFSGWVLLLKTFTKNYIVGFLAVASLFFYGYWDARYIPLLLVSILFNYTFGYLCSKYRNRVVIFIGTTINLILLAYYKYANFFVDSFVYLTGYNYTLHAIILPLGISFFTFTQIAFLIDCYRGQVKERNFIHYCLFVTYFPHLIAGPIIHHKQVMSQFSQTHNYKIDSLNISAGIFMFVVGLCKKVLLADETIPYVKSAFEAAYTPGTLTLFDSWLGALAYTMQLYFDFSGYFDMAIGISYFFNIKLPINFNSPYKAKSIIDFWRRWHITLSDFLRDYLYISLGGNRKGKLRRYINVFLTMFLGGVWHGAGLTYIIWGTLHATYIIINHFWRDITNNYSKRFFGSRVLARLFTFICVMFAWIFFRAENYQSGVEFASAFLGLNGIFLPESWALAFPKIASVLKEHLGLKFLDMSIRYAGYQQLLWLSFLTIITMFFPNSQEMLEKFKAFIQETQSKIHIFTIAALIALTSVYLLYNLNKISEFLYFQF